LVWRHAAGQVPFGANAALNMMFDKWHLGPLRLVNFFALLALTLHFGPRVRATLRCRFLETLGAASLPVFCGHLVIVLLALAAVGDRPRDMPWWAATALIGGSLAVLYAVARISQHAQAPPATVPKGERRLVSAHAVQ
jgi:peptidoglycan/LPS O-acetylase OafA/YrhL